MSKTLPHLLKRTLSACAVLGSVFVAKKAFAPGSDTSSTRPSLLVLGNPKEARTPVRLHSMKVRAQVVGSLATTRVEMEFHNPNKRSLLAELHFPLRENQVVTGFALDRNGRFRSAVAVPNAKTAFTGEAEEDQPSPWSAQASDTYRLPLEPIPAEGRCRVALEITQPLDRHLDARGYAYHLPLIFAEKVGKFDLEVRVIGAPDVHAVRGVLGDRHLSPKLRNHGHILIKVDQSDFEASADLVVIRNGQMTHAVTTELYQGKHYFYAEMPAMPHLGQGAVAARPIPRRLALVWDASSSGAKRELDKELELLNRYFKRIKSTQVLLRVVRDVVDPIEEFTVKDGQWEVLHQRLKDMVYDGATDAALWKSTPDKADFGLIFSDGQVNLGTSAAPATSIPTMAIVSGGSTNTRALRIIAENSGGELVDLKHATFEAALRQMMWQRSHIVEFEGHGVTDITVHSPYPEQYTYRFAGLMSEPQGQIRVTLLNAEGNTFTDIVTISTEDQEETGVGLAAQQWARLKINELQSDELRNASAIERLETYFKLLTPRTSLSILEDPADYVRYDLDPPEDDAEMVDVVGQLLEKRKDAAAAARVLHLDRVTKAFEERLEWWEGEFPKDTRPKREFARDAANTAAIEHQDRITLARRTTRAAIRAATSKSKPGKAVPAFETSGAVTKWTPDSAEARRLRAAEDADIYKLYLEARAKYENCTAFFLDVADLLFERNQPELAARVASNLAELSQGDHHVLRILAYRLMHMRTPKQAVPMLERVLTMASEEPQSWRDLALARAAAGDYRRAVQHLWHVVSTPWKSEAPDIELIALTELNAIVARARTQRVLVNVSMIPERLRKHMPLGIRAVLSWDTSNTNIDLWITDPNGEKAFYGNPRTHQGGATARVYTGGQGPEEFLLRHPKPGKYKVQAHFHGHQQFVSPSTTLMLQFFTDYGTPDQKVEQTILRLSGPDHVIDIGEFVVENWGWNTTQDTGDDQDGSYPEIAPERMLARARPSR